MTKSGVDNSLSFISRLDSLIQRLQHAGIHRRDHVHRGVQLFFGHSPFPCVRKAPLHSRIAQPHHRYRQTDQHLLTRGQAFDSVSIAIESPKVCFLHFSVQSLESRFRW